MKKIVTLIGLLSVAAAGGAIAQSSGGINLSWTDCQGAGGLRDRTVSCTNTGVVQNDMHMSFVAPEPISMCRASEGIIDVYVDAPTLPSWWQETGRWGAATGFSSCPGWYDGAPSGPTVLGPSVVQTQTRRLRIHVTVSVLAGEEQSIEPGVEYLAHILRLRFGPGTFNNPGCLTPACFCANDLLLDQPEPLPDTRLQIPWEVNYVTWRGGGGTLCPLATPARLATWGSVKALYR